MSSVTSSVMPSVVSRCAFFLLFPKVAQPQILQVDSPVAPGHSIPAFTTYTALPSFPPTGSKIIIDLYQPRELPRDDPLSALSPVFAPVVIPVSFSLELVCLSL
ncbi:MAG: hypothetical protein ACFFCW_08785 [Candidatus Hodarchaeota archaeon]